MHRKGLRSLAALCLVGAGALAFAGLASAKTVLKPGGVVVVRAVPTAKGTTLWSPLNEFLSDQEAAREATAAGATKHPGGGLRNAPPSPTPNAVAGADSSLSASWQGLNHFDQRYANGGNQFSLEPPDQGLCAGGPYVVESINLALRVYNTVGGPITGVIDLNSFFGLPAAINRTTGVAGPSLSDPKCYYDTDTQRWFLTVTESDAAPSVRSNNLLAVSETSDPTGAWRLYSLDATDDGLDNTPSHPGCPCFGDQPLIGADAYGFYISTNEYTSDTLAFIGAQVYAMSKTKLEAGVIPPVVQFENPPLVEGPGYSLQPATSPSAADYDKSGGGTEYFLSALDFNGTADNRIASWAITNTSSLNSSTPSVSLHLGVAKSETYAQPLPADQQSGPHPFGEYGANFFYGGALNQPIETLNTNDDRMNQVVYAGTNLYGGVNTAVKQGSDVRAGVAWFKVYPKVNANGTMVGHIIDQGYYAPAGANALFPSIGVTPGGGKAVITFTVSGPSYFPSSAYAVLGSSTIHLAAAGVGPEDGFTGYDPFADDGIARWGDYSAAVATGGIVWIGNEYIAQSCTVAQYQADMTCGGTRSPLANWSTRISAIHP